MEKDKIQDSIDSIYNKYLGYNSIQIRDFSEKQQKIFTAEQINFYNNLFNKVRNVSMNIQFLIQSHNFKISNLKQPASTIIERLREEKEYSNLLKLFPDKINEMERAVVEKWFKEIKEEYEYPLENILDTISEAELREKTIKEVIKVKDILNIITQGNITDDSIERHQDIKAYQPVVDKEDIKKDIEYTGNFETDFFTALKSLGLAEKNTTGELTKEYPYRYTGNLGKAQNIWSKYFDSKVEKKDLYEKYMRIDKNKNKVSLLSGLQSVSKKRVSENQKLTDKEKSLFNSLQEKY